MKIFAQNVEKVALLGSSDVALFKVKNDQLELIISGSGDIQAAGETGSVTLRVKGSGDVKTQKLWARKAKLTISGSGNADVHVAEELHVAISGSGNVHYYGNPKVVNQSILGTGTITKR